MPNTLAFTFEAPYVKASILRYSEDDVDCYLRTAEAEEAYAEFTAAIEAQRREAALGHAVNISHPGTGH